MTYKEWAQEYYESAARVKENIERLKQKMRTSGYEAQSEMKNRLEIMYGMYLDCIHTAELLAKRKGEC